METGAGSRRGLGEHLLAQLRLPLPLRRADEGLRADRSGGWATERPCVRSPSQRPEGPAARTRGRPFMSREASIEQATQPKTVREIREAAQQLAPLALETLRAIMSGEGSDSAKLAAAREVLDRAHGKPRAQGAGGDGADDEGEVVVEVRRFCDPREAD